MNPLTLVKRIQKINSREAALGISDGASWHVKYKDSAYVFVGGIPFDLTEGDLLAVFAQYGEIVDVNLVRDKGTGKSKGFAFIAYEDQRSTNLAVDNLNGAQVLGRVIRVDHVSKYKKKEEEDEEAEQQKREARGVCRAFQRGECNRGAGCKFSHDEQRAANTGWGAEDKSSSWDHDKFDGSRRSEKRSNRVPDLKIDEGLGYGEKDARNPGAKDYNGDIENQHRQGELKTIDRDSVDLKRRSDFKEKERNHRESRRRDTKPDSRDGYDRNYGRVEKRSMDVTEPNSRGDDYGRRDEKRSRRHNSESSPQEDRDDKGRYKRSAHDRDSSSHRHRERDEDRQR